MTFNASPFARQLGRFMSEFVDDSAPLNEAYYIIGADAAIKKYGIITRQDEEGVQAVLRDLALLNESLAPFGRSVSLMIDEQTFDPIGVIREARLVPAPAEQAVD